MSVNVTFEVMVFACTKCGAAYGALKGAPAFCHMCERRDWQEATNQAAELQEKVTHLEHVVRGLRSALDRRKAT